jgi:asparagine synthase (glutamine-hydrolysing)
MLVAAGLFVDPQSSEPIVCGIFGVVGAKPSLDADAALARVNRMAHRGPDAASSWAAPNGFAALAHRRLAVVDLSPASAQPMLSADGLHAIVFNGEIYNYRQVREALEALGWVFRSAGDTEVILAAYRHWGADCVQQFNGMFAFAIYERASDGGPGTLFFARDRAGEKPFYYRCDRSAFEFASELKALDHGAEINMQALNHYLSLGYVPGGLCLFEGVHKLPPAHCGLWDARAGQLKLWRYWAPPANDPQPDCDGQTLAQEAAGYLEDSVALRLEADVPVGVLLSGGLDSSLVVAAAARVSSRPVETFTIALPGSSLDEAHHAQVVATHFGTRHHVLPLEETGLGQLDRFMPFVDEPIADSSILPAWLVFGLARREVTVALGGDGGDELFGGYGDYTTSLRDLARTRWMPSATMAAMAHAASQLPAGVPGRNRLASLRGGACEQLIWGRPYFDWVLRRRILKGDAVAALGGDVEAPEQFLLSLFRQGKDPVDRMTRAHFGAILPDDFLVKVDRASMACSLEVRAPFLDHRLIEFAFGRVPSRWKVQGGESRRLQRLIAAHWLPPELDINRKQGFSIPINEWLRVEGERGLMARMEGLPEQIDMDETRRLVRGHLRGRANGGRLFALIMLAGAVRNAAP